MSDKKAWVRGAPEQLKQWWGTYVDLQLAKAPAHQLGVAP
jgi:hypothetical protein